MDLNLLPPLIALLEERQVSKAADRVRLSQPAMSRTLQRLRRTFRDELLVRGPDGFQLTSRGRRIQQELASLMPQLDQLFADEPFDPAAAMRTYRLSGSDYSVLAFGTELFRRVLARSPRSSLYFENWHDHVFDALDDGSIDLVFYGGTSPAHLRCERLFTDQFACVVSADHPLARGGAIQLTDYLRWPHLIIAVTGGRQPAIDDRLRELHLSRQPGLVVPYHAAAAATLPGTSLIATLPARLVTRDQSPGLAILPAPSQIQALPYCMAWSPQADRDPAHLWLRTMIRDVTSVTAQHGSPLDHRSD